MNVTPYTGTDEELRALITAAAQDSHVVVAPTHVVRDDKGEIVGYGSIGGAVLATVWLDSQRVQVAHSLRLLGQCQEIARDLGDTMIMTCAHNSPFYPKMAKLGFTNLGFTSMQLKDLKG